jgi:hypothetical protein
VFHLTHEIEASEMTALEAVLTVDEERARLEREADLLNTYITEEVRQTDHCLTYRGREARLADFVSMG